MRVIIYSSNSMSARKPAGRAKTMPNEKRIPPVTNDANGLLSSSRGSANKHGKERILGESLKVESSFRGSTTGPVGRECTITNSPSLPISSFPASEAETPRLTSENVNTTFLDSVLSLCRKSLTSSGDNAGFAEFIFLDLVKICGVLEAKWWADALGIPHEQSYSLISTILYGVMPRVPQSSKRGPSIPLPLLA